MRWRFVIGLAAAFAAQAGIVAAMVWSRADVLENGREIVVRSTFVDPRDIFRGHYVRLNLSVVPVEEDGIAADLTWEDETAAGPRYVSLVEGRGGFWVADAVLDAPPGEGVPYLRVKRLVEGRGQRPPRILLPFDRYFADYDRAQELENLRREQRLGVILALDGEGGAVIGGLTVDGEKVYDEPLW